MVFILFVFAVFLGISDGALYSPRIVGGSPTTIKAYPSIVQLETFGFQINPIGVYWSQTCGATILTNNILVSAAHCIGYNVDSRRIRAGATYRNRGGVISYISQILNNTAYDNNSVAATAHATLILLRDHLSFGKSINFISLIPQGWEIADGSPATYVGWGRTENNRPSDVLHHVHVHTVSHEECERRHGYSFHYGVVCAGHDGRDACGGDYGGPLYHGGVLAGIIVHGGPEICGHSSKPGVAIKVSAYTNWIIENAVLLQQGN